MKDLHINIGGPRDRARQRVSVRIHQEGNRSGLDAEEVARLLGEFRAAVDQTSLSADDLRRIEWHLSSISEESRSRQPLLDEIQGSLQSIQRIVQSAQTLAPVLLGPLKALAAGLGLSLGS